jgi:tripartite-type tricarboxylate transporter receptor subunit TctC
LATLLHVIFQSLARAMNRAMALAIAVGALGAGAADLAPAQSYPVKPIRVLVAQAAGGATDIVTRIYTTRLAELLGQPVVVDNRPGAGGNIAGDIVARSVADGYTLCAVSNGTVAIAPHFIKVSYSVGKDLAPVALGQGGQGGGRKTAVSRAMENVKPSPAAAALM